MRNENDTPRRRKPSLLSCLTNEILLFKDFTTVLEKRQDKRQAVLAQLREIYDGRFRKVWGNGIELDWEGKLGFIAGVTPAIDKHHAVMAILGPRFLQLRLRQPDRRQAGLRAVQNAQRDDRKIREGLAKRVAELIDGLPDTTPTLVPAHQETVVAVAELVTRARSAVERDPRSRELAYTPVPEMPPRFSRQLASLASGIALVSGHTEVTDDDVRRVARVGLDGIPPARRACLEHLAAGRGWTVTSDVAAALRCSTTHARRTLEDLEVLDLVRRKSNKVSQIDRWSLHPTRSLVVRQWLGKPSRRRRQVAFALSAQHQQVLTALAAFPGGEAQLRDIRARAGLPVRSCQRSATRLVQDGHAQKPHGTRGWYRITAKGRTQVATATRSGDASSTSVDRPAGRGSEGSGD